MLFKHQLHGYQRRNAKFQLAKKRVASWMGMGLGKTASTLTSVEYLVDRMLVGPVLVVAPKRVAISVWPEEIKKWMHLRHLRVSICCGSANERLMALQRKADIYTINVENLMWLAKLPASKRPKFSVIVLDEASQYKSGGRQGSNRYKAARFFTRNADYVWELTASPAPNGLMDLWAQMHLLDHGARLGHTLTDYRQRWFFHNTYTNRWEPHKFAAEQIPARVQDIVLVMNTEDYMELPPFIVNPIYVDLNSSQRAQYTRMEKEFLIQVGEDLSVEIEAPTEAARSNKLLQLANGAVYDENKATHFFHDLKLQALQELVETSAGNPLLVAYNFKSDLKRITEGLKDAIRLDDDPNTIKRWNRGQIPVLLAHPASAGHGLNLQEGGHNLAWFGLNWSLELFEQFNGRLRRQGQTRPVVLNLIIARDTIDEVVLQVIRSKDKTQAGLKQAVLQYAQDRMAA